MWVNLLVNLAIAAVAYLLAPKPEPPSSADIEDFDIPIAKEGKVIRKIYGTRWISDPQVVWYGDLRKSAIKSSSGKK